MSAYGDPEQRKGRVVSSFLDLSTNPLATSLLDCCTLGTGIDNRAQLKVFGVASVTAKEVCALHGFA